MWGWGAVLCFPQDYNPEHPCMPLPGFPLRDNQAQPSLPTPLDLHLGLLMFEGTMSRPGSASGRIWSGFGRQPSFGSSPEDVEEREGVLTRLPALDRGLRGPWGKGLLRKSLVPSPPRQVSDGAWALEEGKPSGHAGLPGRKPVVPRWPQDNADYRGG